MRNLIRLLGGSVAVLWLGGYGVASEAATTIDCRPEPNGRLVDIGGYRMHVDCQGEGSPTVVLLPGSGDFSFDWSLVQSEIAKRTRVASYDRGGSAWSDVGPAPYTMRQEAHDLHLALARAEIPPP